MKKISQLLLCGGALACLLVPNKVRAQDSTSTGDDFFQLDLEDLLNMEVKVASKRAEKNSDAPGMITSYSANDVERFGYYTLKDLANITSGYSSFSAFGETNLETRGQKAGSWNVSKHLLMIDGIPVNHSRANSAPLEYQVPLFFADKVEFLKGPGSALYGTSAFYGVMNVSSKTLKKQGVMAETKMSYGDAGNSNRIMGNAVVKNEVGQTNLSFSYFKKGFSGDSLGGGAVKTQHFNNDNSVFLNSSFKLTDTKLKGLGIGLIYMRRNSHAGEFWGATPSPVNEVTWEQYIPYVKYQRELSENVSLNSYVKYNGSNEKSTFGASWNTMIPGSVPFSGYDYLTADFEGLAEVTYKISDKSEIIAGINYDTRQELGSPLSFAWNVTGPLDTTQSYAYTFNRVDYDGTVRVNVASAYAQYRNEFDVLKGLIVTAGGRLDNGFSDAGTYSQFSPRLGLVQRITDKINIKALYGQALRVPGIKEIGLNAEIIEEVKNNGGTGNPDDIPDVGAEVIKSFEGGLNFHTKQFNAAIAYFYNITTEALDGRQYSYVDNNNQPQNPNYFANIEGEIVASGMEIDLQYALNKDFRVMLNHAFAKAVLNDTMNFLDVPTQKTNAAVSYTIPGPLKLTASAVVRHIWGYTTDSAKYNNLQDVDVTSDTEVAGYTMLDLNFLIPVNKNFGFEVQARNLLDTKWRQPSLLGPAMMIPLEGRNFMFTVYGRF